MKSSINIKNFFFDVIYVSLFYFLFYKGISYTDDLASYQADYDFYTNYDFYNYSEIIFSLINKISVWLNLDFQTFYNTILFINLWLWAKVFRCYLMNPIIGLSFLSVMLYIQFANQIAFFMGLPIVLISYYEYYIRERHLFGILLFIIGFGIHPGLIGYVSLFFLFQYIDFFNQRKKIILRKDVIFGSIGFFSIGFGAALLIMFVPYYSTYILGEGASFFGMLWALLFPSTCLYLLWRLTPERLNKNPMMALATGLVSFTFIWMIISFCGIQIINARYVNCLCCMWLCYIGILKDNNIIKKYSKVLSAFFFISFLVRYSGEILGFSDNDTSAITKAFLIWTSRFQ